jgi:glucosamine-6-phosphate deaminase
MMEVMICENADAASELAAKFLKNQMKKKRHSVLGLATGTTPLRMYEKLATLVHAEGVDVSEILSFNLDEYVGLPPEHPASYAHYMQKHFTEPLGLSTVQVNLPNGLAADLKKECERYEKMIEQRGPIDLQILGLGQDGHIGFNEPSSSLGSRTRVKCLTEQTRKINSSHFSSLEEVPRHVMTMGVQTILDSQKIALMAFGETKASAVASMVEGPISASCPASVLQWHRQVTVFLDPAAASQLENKGYYQQVLAHKPSWQMQDFI